MEAAIIQLHPPSANRFLIIDDSGNTLPLYTSTVPAGFPSPAADYASEPIDLNRYASSIPGSTFLIEVVGDSMIKAGILPEDLAEVNRDLEPQNGNVVLACLSGDEFTIKRLRKEKDATYLDPENDNYKPIRIDSPEAGIIWGVVVGIHRRKV